MTSDKIKTKEEAKNAVREWQAKSEKVVFTNGCFDILHLGHIDYLEKSRAEGDRLVIGLNTDTSVRKLKGEERPVNSEYARARMLAALGFVDAVTLFSEDTPLALISFLLPDILIKGNDYAVSDIVGGDVVIANGGEVRTLPLVEGYSTTSLIERIRKES